MTTPMISDYLKYANLQMAAEAFLVDDRGSKWVSFAFIFISEQSCRAADVSNSPKSRCASFCAA